MSDWFFTAIEMQREIVRAQQVRLDAVRKVLDTASAATDVQAMGRQATQAQMQAWAAWARLWGFGK